MLEQISVKERNIVYLAKIDTFDMIDIGSTWRPFALFPYTKKIFATIFIEIPSNLRIKEGDILNFTGKIRENIHFPLKGYERFAYFQKGYGSVFL